MCRDGQDDWMTHYDRQHKRKSRAVNGVGDLEASLVIEVEV